MTTLDASLWPARLSDDLLLQSVSARGAALAPDMVAPASIQPELPPLDGLKP